MEIDCSEHCDSWTLKDCDQCKRILFCLSYYRLWIEHKYKQQQLKKKTKNKKRNDDNNVYKDFLSEFIDSLKYYSSVQMLNDFHHIKQFHIGGDNNNSSMKQKT